MAQQFPPRPRLSELRFVGSIASGGMGYVEKYALKRGPVERFVAIKRLHPHLRKDDSFRRMFLDEARLASLISHPNVVRVIDVWEDELGPALAMDFIDGCALSNVLKFYASHDNLMPFQFALSTACDAAVALHAAHETRDTDGHSLSLIHRDVSPQNILLSRDSRAFLTDFGVAKALERSSKTATGVVKGKNGYMAPEMLLFESVDRRADLFSLGVVLFEMLATRRLYEGVQGSWRILNEHSPDIADYRDDVPPPVVELLFALLAKNPSDRPKNALEVSQVLRHSLDESVSFVGRIPFSEVIDELSVITTTPSKNTHGSRRLPYIAALAGLGCVLILLFVLFGGNKNEKVTPSIQPLVSEEATGPKPTQT
ncbi:MAG: serine/threonine-protein kinase, partial [Myxococcota bacterium]